MDEPGRVDQVLAAPERPVVERTGGLAPGGLREVASVRLVVHLQMEHVGRKASLADERSPGVAQHTDPPDDLPSGQRTLKNACLTLFYVYVMYMFNPIRRGDRFCPLTTFRS